MASVTVLHELQRDLIAFETTLHFLCKKVALIKKTTAMKTIYDDILESTKNSNIVCFDEWKFNIRKAFTQLWNEELNKFNKKLQNHLNFVIAQCKKDLDAKISLGKEVISETPSDSVIKHLKTLEVCVVVTFPLF